ncbi:hypothetical protein C1701_08595 [Actinoalloteichus sp. AHMU CJ021]|uniref:Uncharacterized protein n=1 Tax=Actinoalloteichus caeruleus DSM 43889 TaxID=1120930 RepID=A0ABT1JL89_ACTCY|nr:MULTISPECIES: hypothetical protein [Actinoalloteichus]AUS78418.1 hypothetical protein C1701_08595 [Actinoalloteichus sp. AHMU CJ021]MCP2332501.1 hypothetical protein [Actinoalloteichus caeruleus DSM 43889]
MAGVEEVRAGIAQANQEINEALTMLRQIQERVDRAQATLTNAMQGSMQPEVQQSQVMLSQGVELVNQAYGQLSACVTTTDGYAARL